MATDIKTLWGFSKDVLTIAIIPLFLWGVKLEVDNALRDERISSLQSEVAEAKGIDQEVRENSDRLIKVETKLDLANALLAEIKDEVEDR